MIWTARLRTAPCDAQKRVVEYEDEAGVTYHFTYDALGCVRRVDLPDGKKHTGEGYSKVFTHRPDGSLASRTTAIDGFPAVKFELTYYEDGSPHTQMITQLDASGSARSNSELVFGVDAYGRLHDVEQLGARLLTATYDGNGLLSGANFVNGDQLSFTYDGTTRRLVGSSQATASYAVSTQQQMNARALVESETVTIGATTLARTFGYSETGQRFLTSAGDAQNRYVYGFDPFGLPTSITTNGAARAIAETATTLTAGQVTYGFDALHRTVSRTDASAPEQGLVLTYGPDGQVATATKGGVTYQFRYDEDGQRLVKLTGDMPTAAYLPEGYLDSSGLTERFALGGRTVGIIKDGVYTSIATDLRGSVLAETTGIARIPSPFGQRDVHPAMAAAIDYVEKGYDADLGWVRMGVRDYDPVSNRFTTPDPLLLESPEKCVRSTSECNLFGYAAANPLSRTDPTGLQSGPPPEELEAERVGEAPSDVGSQMRSARWANANEELNRIDPEGRHGAVIAPKGWVPSEEEVATQEELAKTMREAKGAAGGEKSPEQQLESSTTDWVTGRLRSRADQGAQALGRGSTANLSKGTTLPRNIREQSAVDEAIANPRGGNRVPLKMTDPRWPGSDGWVKMQQVIESGGREGPINVHYLFNETTGEVDDFKIVLPGAR